MKKLAILALCAALLLTGGCGAPLAQETPPAGETEATIELIDPSQTELTPLPIALPSEDPEPSPEATPEPTPEPTPMPTELVLSDESAEEILAYAEWTQLTYIDARASREYGALCALQEVLPDCRVEWLFELQGETYNSLETESLKLSSTEGLPDALSALPRVKQVDLLEASVPDEEKDALMAAFPGVDFLWRVRFGRWSLRSDVQVFSTMLSGSDSEHRYTSSELEPLFKYCRHLRALDLGHNDLRDLSLLGTLTELQVLILVDNPFLIDIGPLANLTELRYLELFCCYKIQDFSSLSALTLLEDINLCHEGLLKDPSIFDNLTNLKVCWMRGVGFTWAQKQAFREAHPDARIEFEVYKDPQSSTDGGWRATDENVAVRTAFYNQELVSYFDYWEDIRYDREEDVVWLLPTKGS